MAGLYGKSSELVAGLLSALKRGEPLLDAGLSLVQQASVTLARCDRALDRVDRILAAGESLAPIVHENARLERRRLELEIQRLEHSPISPQAAVRSGS